jgi:hypothetical protein
VCGHVFQHVRRRLNWPLTNLIHADFVATVLSPHVSAARYASDPDVHVLRVRSIGRGCRGHWDSDHGLSLAACPTTEGRHVMVESVELAAGI